jgi:cell division protein FtsQ
MQLFFRKNKRKTPITAFIWRLLKIIILLLIITLIAWGVMISNPTKFLNISISWDIDERLPISEQRLIDNIQPHITDKFNIDLHQIKESIEKEPWVERANVKRLFWNYIRIKVYAKTIAMKWQNAQCIDNLELPNCLGYISSKGDLFIPEEITESETISAISNTEIETLESLYSDYKLYNSILQPMTIKTIIKTNIDKLILEPNITVILGYKKQEERLGRFKKAYSKLRKKTKKVNQAIFDMRYPKGFSISYK